VDHLLQAWSNLRIAWSIPDNIRGYPLPRGGQFATPRASLDPDIFDQAEKMHPWIRESILGMLGAFWNDPYPGWQSWVRVYLAGSLASYWYGTPDFDVLIGVETSKTPLADLTDNEVCGFLTQEFYERLDPLTAHFTFPPAPDLHEVITSVAKVPEEENLSAYNVCPSDLVPLGPVEITWYVNSASYDITRIRPYAAYEVISDKWVVHPPKMDKNWGPQSLSYTFWTKMADLADQIKAILVLPLTERLPAAQSIYDRLHSQRSKAFSAQGIGVTDPRALQWIVMERWGLLGSLELAIHPDRPVGHLAPAIARLS
jgi:hypothetical protein